MSAGAGSGEPQLSLRRLPPVDLRLETTQPTALGNLRLTATPRAAVLDGRPRAATPYNFGRVEALAADVYRRIHTLVDTGPFTPQSLADPQLAALLSDLGTHLFGIRFSQHGLTLGELMSRVIAETADGTPLVSVDPVLGQIPWELTRLPDHPDRPLGDLVHVCGSLEGSPGDDDVHEGLLAVSAIGAGRRAHPFEGSVEIRAAGDRALAGGDEEAAYLDGARGTMVARVAPAVRAPADEAPFFGHFGAEGYDIVHLFAHCAYDQDGFVIGVTESYELGTLRFKQHGAAFRPGAFHFLNVCSGAPTPANRTRSLVEYVQGEQGAGAVLATLATVRSRSAWHMARAFYEAFLPPTPGVAGPPAVAALAQARRSLLAEGNAEGYLYRMYGRPDVRLVPLPAAGDPEAA